jgi:hypothetical protein
MWRLDRTEQVPNLLFSRISHLSDNLRLACLPHGWPVRRINNCKRRKPNDRNRRDAREGHENPSICSCHQYAPVDWSNLEAAVEGRPEMKVRRIDRNQPDVWIIQIGWASQAALHQLERSW